MKLEKRECVRYGHWKEDKQESPGKLLNCYTVLLAAFAIAWIVIEV